MRNLILAASVVALALAVGCHDRSTQTSQTQTTGAPAGPASSSGNGSGDNSGTANHASQMNDTNGNAPAGAPLENGQLRPNEGTNGNDMPASGRQSLGYQRLEPTAKADAGH